MAINEFWETTEKKEFKSFDRPVYLKTTPGKHTIRILEVPPRKYYAHWIKGTSIECIEGGSGNNEDREVCPQCELNRKIVAEAKDWKQATQTDGYSYKQERGVVNILDRTDVKICPSLDCQEENKASSDASWALVCRKCGIALGEVEIHPSNKVKLLSKGKTAFEQLAGFHKSRLDEYGNTLSIVDFDINLIAVGNTSVFDTTDNFDKVNVPEDSLFDLENSSIKLDVDEMRQRMRNVSLRDIFSARHATSNDDFSEDVERIVEKKPTKSMEEITEDVDKLFFEG